MFRTVFVLTAGIEFKLTLRRKFTAEGWALNACDVAKGAT